MFVGESVIGGAGVGVAVGDGFGVGVGVGVGVGSEPVTVSVVDAWTADVPMNSVAVIIVVPTAVASTLPDDETLATDGLEEVH